MSASGATGYRADWQTLSRYEYVECLLFELQKLFKTHLFSSLFGEHFMIVIDILWSNLTVALHVALIFTALYFISLQPVPVDWDRLSQANNVAGRLRNCDNGQRIINTNNAVRVVMHTANSDEPKLNINSLPIDAATRGVHPLLWGRTELRTTVFLQLANRYHKQRRLIQVTQMIDECVSKALCRFVWDGKVWDGMDRHHCSWIKVEQTNLLSKAMTTLLSGLLR